MKKHLTLFILFVVPFFSKAQIQAGSFLVGGTMNFTDSHQFTERTKFQDWDTDFTLNTQFGYFLTRDLVIGLNVNYSKFNNAEKRTENVHNRSRQSFIYSPFLRYYLTKGLVRPYLNFIAQFERESHSIKTPTFDFEEKGSAFQYFGGFGLNVFLTQNIALNATLNIKLTDSGDLNFFEPEILKDVLFNAGIQLFINKNQITIEPIRGNYLKKGNHIFEFNSTGATKWKHRPFNLNVMSGLRYFVSDKTEIGGSFNVSFSDFVNKIDSYSGGLTFNFRQFIPLTPKWYFSPSLRFNYGYHASDFVSFTGSGFDATRLKTHTYEGALRPEFWYFLGNRTIAKIGFWIGRLHSEQQVSPLELDLKNKHDILTHGWQTGFEYFVQNNISFELTVFRALTKDDFDSKTELPSSSLNYLAQSSLMFGINYFLPSKNGL